MADIPTRNDFPRKIEEIENTWIPMRDGTRLAARIWLPVDADKDPVPAILEYLPYRKRDGTVERDHLTHPYFAGFGYAGVRVDMRGTGDSEGICQGEYLLQEQEDCLDVIEWLSEQSWCTGKVGMIGISWGGFNGLQVAARRPKALGAVISLCSTDDRYADDIHFMGGAVLTDKLAWGATAFAIAHTPPDPAIVGERWREMWLKRLEGNGLWLLDWFRHQRRDEFYAHGSICENYADVEIPVYLIGGWADGYTNTILRMLENLRCPRKGLIGPWAHKYPHFAQPGPRIGFLQESLRWWDQHLKGIDTGIMAEPQLQAWIQSSVEPAPFFENRPGNWVSERAWSGNRESAQTLFLVSTPHGVLTSEQPKPSDSFSLSSPENCGHTAGSWCGYGLVADGPLDQNGEDGMLWFETAPLEDDLQVLGFPMLDVTVCSETAQANLIAVLSEVSGTGKATLLSYGVLNLTHRNSDEQPEALPAESVNVKVQLNACGHRLSKGNRLRLALATAYWPVIWPSPSTVTLVLTNASLVLPTNISAVTEPHFQSAEGATPMQMESLSAAEFKRVRSIDQVTGTETIERYADTGWQHHKHTGLDVRYSNRDSYQIHPDDPNSAVATCSWHKCYARGDWHADVKTRVTVRALTNVWQIEATLEASDAKGLVMEKSWSEKIKRDLV